MRAGGAQEIREERAGGAREIAEEGGEVVVEETVVENAAVLEKLEKNGAFATLVEDPEASGGREAVPEEIRKVRAGGARETEERAGGAREAEEIADNFTEEDEFPEENAAVLEILEKN